MEKIYTLLLVLFVLSQISERVANFLKLKLSDTRLLFEGTDKTFWKYFSFRNTKTRSADPEKEKDREFRILKINVATGLLVSLIFRTDLFCILRNIADPASHMGWTTIRTDYHAYIGLFDKCYVGSIFFGLSTLLGCLITGVFLSFGSKFWHDLVDLLLQAKNYRSMLTQEGLDKLRSSFQTLDYGEQESIMDAAINEHYNSWKQIYPNIVGCSSGLKKTDNQELPQNAIIFKVDGKGAVAAPTDMIPKEIRYRGHVIPTDVIDYAAPFALIKFPGADEMPSLLGHNVSLAGFFGFGSTGVKVKKNGDDYLLSCFHVLCIDYLKQHPNTSGGLEFHNSRNAAPHRISIPSALYIDGNPVEPSLKGYFTDGVLSAQVDAAIARITGGELANTTFEDGGKSLNVTGEFVYDKLFKGLKVETYGCISGRRTGTVADIKAQKTEVKIEGDGYAFRFTFNSLIELDCPCESGDSGAPALSTTGELLGIVIAGNLKKTFVVPFPFIKNALHITL